METVSLLVELPAQAARTHNPTNPSQPWFPVKCGRFCVEVRREAERKKARFKGVWEVKP